MKSESVEGASILALHRTGDEWKASGRLSARLGNQIGEISLPHLPSAGWNYEQGLLTAYSDRHGFVPIYYYDGPKGFGVASSWVDLQQYFRLDRFDDAAIACYLRLGHYLADDTPFEGVRRLSPDSTLVWSDGAYRIDQADTIVPDPARIGRSQAINEYGERFQHAIESILQTTHLAPINLLSGGQDSRHILLAMNQAGVCPEHCLTQTPPLRGERDDAAVASRLCQRLNVPVRVIERLPRSVAAEASKNQLLGMESAYHAWLLPLADALSSLERGLIFDGLGGDALSASRFLTNDWIQAVRAGCIEQATSAYMGTEGHLPKMLHSGWLKRWPRALAEERVSAELRRYLDYPNPQSAFQLRNRTRRAIAASLWPMLAKGHDVALPYFHPDVFDFLITLPMEMLTGRRFHREAIEGRYPEFKDIPYAEIGDKAFVASWLPEPVRGGFALASQRELGQVLRPNYLRVRSARALLQRSYIDRLDEWLQPAIYLGQLVKLIERTNSKLV